MDRQQTVPATQTEGLLQLLLEPVIKISLNMAAVTKKKQKTMAQTEKRKAKLPHRKGASSSH